LIGLVSGFDWLLCGPRRGVVVVGVR